MLKTAHTSRPFGRDQETTKPQHRELIAYSQRVCPSMLPCNYFEERHRNERTGRQESLIVRLSDVCWARAGQASTFEHEQWAMHGKHIACGHVVLCMGACGDVWVCTQTKTRRNMIWSRKSRRTQVLRATGQAGKAGRVQSALN
jgi:hypothetical protein